MVIGAVSAVIGSVTCCCVVTCFGTFSLYKQQCTDQPLINRITEHCLAENKPLEITLGHFSTCVKMGSAAAAPCSSTAAPAAQMMVLGMESLYKEKGKELLSEQCCRELATKFSCSPHRIGKAPIQCKQVESWFTEKHNRMAAKDTPKISFEAFVASLRNKATGSSSPATPGQVVPLNQSVLDDTNRTPCKSKAERVAELSDLQYEALSAKDGAWFDVASFLNYRVLYTGEIEVRVRFSGFNHDEDEWVNMRRAVRERSIPLVPSECHKIKVGDLVLCYRANADHALYSDAHILAIERNVHDAEACTCIFLVRFYYDNTEAKVDLTQVCCRPT